MQKIEFVLGPSRLLAILFLVLYGSSCLILYFLNFPLLIKLISIAFLCWDYTKKLNLYARRSAKRAIVQLWQDTKGRFGYTDNKGQSAITNLIGDSYKSSFFLILHLKSKTKKQSIFIPRDALSSEEYRLLRARIAKLELLN